MCKEKLMYDVAEHCHITFPVKVMDVHALSKAVKLSQSVIGYNRIWYKMSKN